MFAAPRALIVMFPAYVPGASCEAFAETWTVAGVNPEVGFTLSHRVLPLMFADAVHDVATRFDVVTSTL